MICSEQIILFLILEISGGNNLQFFKIKIFRIKKVVSPANFVWHIFAYYMLTEVYMYLRLFSCHLLDGLELLACVTEAMSN